MSASDDERFAGMIAAALAPSNARAAAPSNAREITSPLCPCGSGRHAYNLFDTKGALVMYCCISCEKSRREKADP